MRALALALLTVAAPASAQGTKTPATSQGTKAPATNTQAKQATTQTKQDTKAAAPSAGATKTGVGTKTPVQGATKQDTKVPAGAQRAGGAAITVAPEPAPRPLPPIMREAFDYDAGGRRDPFFSLLASTELRPTVADLQLTSVLYHPTRPIAIMRDASTKTRYTVTLGTTLGRMRVVLIRPRVVIFTIEEFGINRQDSLVLVDSAKARAK